MKVLYGIQATGNGHVMRALEIIPLLRKTAEVDILMSGIRNSLSLPFMVKYRYHGLSFALGKNGGINYLQTYHQTKSIRFLTDVLNLPLEKYDIIIQDFEPTIAWAGRLRNKNVIALSHQSAVLNEAAPKPSVKDPVGKQILKNYAPSKYAYGFHFKAYDQGIFTPVIRKTVREIRPSTKNHHTVYLPSYHDSYLVPFLSSFKHVHWEVFSPHTTRAYSHREIKVFPVSQENFLQSMSSSSGVLCGAGFETPAEALFLKKRLMVIPMKNQYEQQCNAASLKQMGVPVIKALTAKNRQEIQRWLDGDQKVTVNYPNQTELILTQVIEEQA